MDIHGNAKTTPRMRQLMLRRVTQGWTYEEIADALAVSERTVAKWVARSRRDASLVDGSSRPCRIARQTSPTLTAAIVRLRRPATCSMST